MFQGLLRDIVDRRRMLVTVQKNLEELRKNMVKNGLKAYLITGSDPHGSETPPFRWGTREWISGFTGSAGTVAVTSSRAGLWTDFRYWIQAADELKGTGIELFRDGTDKVLPPADWLTGELSPGDAVGIDGRTISAGEAAEIELTLKKAGIRFQTDVAPWEECWTCRPLLPESPVLELAYDECGESRAEKISRLRKMLEESGADAWIGTALDSAAWLLNTRGGDVPYVPVAAGFIIFRREHIIWYTNREKVSREIVDSLAEDNVEIRPYDDFLTGVKSMDRDRLLFDYSRLSRGVLDAIPPGVTIIEGDDPVFMMKAIKNQVEAAKIVRAMEKDGVAMVQFLKELDDRISEGESFSEIEASNLLLEKRQAIPGFLSESFSPIPAVDGNGAICHYEAKEESAGTLRKGTGLFLIDSGGQWEEGTTDITRTVTLGSPTSEQITDYTLVLKGHVALSSIRFPKGTRGYQLDTLARMHLWNAGRDYGHGTGHGVGFRLNVHEGPQVINIKPVDVPFVPGMIVSNEPGVYRENHYGIRIENLMICREDISGEFGDFLAFDTLTLAPYDSRLIDTDMLDDSEISWINAYQRRVYETLSPLLEAEEALWLKARTAALKA